MKHFLIFSFIILAGCNFVNMKPGSVDKTQTFYTDRGGYSMKHSIKPALEKRGYKVIVGKETSSRNLDTSVEESDSINMDINKISGARYIVKVVEARERFAPIWCVFNGVWWWHFNVSIADNNTGEELLNWSGHGCRNSSIRKLNRYLEKLEKVSNQDSNL